MALEIDPTNGHLYTEDVLRELGITRDALYDLAEREGVDRLHGVWGTDEVKRMAARLVVTGSPVERENAKRVITELAATPPVDRLQMRDDDADDDTA